MTRRRRTSKSPYSPPHAKHKAAQAGKRNLAPRQPAISGRRLWMFRITTALVSCLLFLSLLEVSLRLAGCGYPPRPIIRYSDDGFEGYVDNARFSWRFFPRNLAREFNPFTLPPRKGKDTYRIFICGSSAAQGDPDGAYSFARILDVMLRHRWPDASFEVINTGMTAINSHVVLPIVRDCARHEPDMFIIYCGNNEVVGPYGPGTVFAGMANHLWFSRLGITLRATRTGQCVAGLTDRLRSDEAIRSWGGMEMFLDKQVRLTDDAMKTVYRNFQQNLEDLRDTALHAGASVILCTVASNLRDCPPFASLHRADLTNAELQQWNQMYDNAVALEASGRYADAVEQYLAAAGLDNTFADLHFRLATCYLRMGRVEQAKAHFAQAREYDTLRFRADDTINEIIRNTAHIGGQDTACLDFARIIEAHTPDGIPGKEHLYEHVHFNFSGNYLLAKCLFELIESQIKDRFGPGDNDTLLSEADCAARLAYTRWDEYRLTEKILREYIEKPPFTNQLYHDDQVASLEAQLASCQPVLQPESLRACVEQYRHAIHQHPTDWNLHFKLGRLLAEELKDYSGAAAEFALVQKCVPHFHRGYTAMGQVLAALDKTKAAIEQYRKAVRRDPGSADACYHLGIACARLGSYRDAETWFRQAIALRPTSPIAFNKLAEMLNRQGKIDAAIEVCRRGLAVAPNDAMLHGNLAILLNTKGLKPQALAEIQTALKLDPDSANIRRVYEIIRNSR